MCILIWPVFKEKVTFLGSLDLLLVCPGLAESSRPELGQGPICGHWSIILSFLALIFFDPLLSAWLFRSLKSWSEQLRDEFGSAPPLPGAVCRHCCFRSLDSVWPVPQWSSQNWLLMFPPAEMKEHIFSEGSRWSFPACCPSHLHSTGSRRFHVRQSSVVVATANRSLKAVPSNPGNISFKALTDTAFLPRKTESTLDRTEYVRGGVSSLMKWICEVTTVSWIRTVSPAPDISTSISQAHVKTGWPAQLHAKKDPNPVCILKSSVETFPSWLCCCLWCSFFFVFTVLVLFNDFLLY